MTPLLVDRIEFRIHAAICAVLVLKLVANASAVGAARIVRKAWGSPEDPPIFGGSVGTDELVERLRRLHLNSLENELPFMILGLLFVLVGAPQVGIQAYGYTFLFARLGHAVAYLLRLQPFRSVLFGVDVLCLVGMAVQILLTAFR